MGNFQLLSFSSVELSCCFAALVILPKSFILVFMNPIAKMEDVVVIVPNT
ncbi:hypothetical protein [Flavobacterium soyangense]|uniref:Uncharacterized protein n=1 Tax=Flavobacterium soyangense TaxID=2023265 RepID=A0A930UEC9_9FLAO|nr:hypothetical protein [Flavobacterium soyangense]MBF2709869.1 hypothetical protein [Flavobacterium soyangense]